MRALLHLPKIASQFNSCEGAPHGLLLFLNAYVTKLALSDKDVQDTKEHIAEQILLLTCHYHWISVRAGGRGKHQSNLCILMLYYREICFNPVPKDTALQSHLHIGNCNGQYTTRIAFNLYHIFISLAQTVAICTSQPTTFTQITSHLNCTKHLSNTKET